MMLKLVFWSLLLLPPWLGSGQKCADDGRCDMHERCPMWERDGECWKSPEYMRVHCPVSCEDTYRNRSKLKEGECDDLHERCWVWAKAGECEENPDEMHKFCAKSCGMCGKQSSLSRQKVQQADVPCEDKNVHCEVWAKYGECEKNAKYMKLNCPWSCGSCDQDVWDHAPTIESDSTKDDLREMSSAFGVRQDAAGADAERTLERIKRSIDYMNDEKTLALPENVLRECKNRHELCAFWAAIGECEKNRAYMVTNCAPSCMTCNLIDMKSRCPPLEKNDPALRPGDLNKLFERIVQEAPGNRTLSNDEREALKKANMTEYTVHVHSRPFESPGAEVDPVVDKSLPPWVITFDNFLTDEECDSLVQLGFKYGYKRSEDVGGQKFDGGYDSVKSDRRTSENAWCSDFQGCRSEQVPQIVQQRMAQVIQIPANNSEDLQILKYEVGQYYRTHHDFIAHQADRQCGPRILTFFLYLSDVEEGGGTNFPQLDITVEPKKGRALLWPSVLNSSPMGKDNRMMHQALEVIKGTKFAANGWIHMYDYVTPQANGCN